jgi:hypothetical protein
MIAAEKHGERIDVSQQSARTGASISSGASLFSHLVEEMAHIIQTTDENHLQCLTIELTLPAG